MKPLLATVFALSFLLPAGARAGDPVPEVEFSWAPRYLGKLADYFPEVQTDFGRVKAKMGRVARRCPGLRLRGPRLTVKKQPPTEPQTASGFFQVFGDANQKRDPATITFVVDPTGLRNVGSRVAVELDSPFVPVGDPVNAFTILSVARQADDTFRVSVFVPGMPSAVEVGDPLTLPADTPGVFGQMVYDEGLVNVAARSCTSAAPPVVVASDVPLAFGGSAGVGAGITGQKGDAGGFHIAVSGDLYDATKQDLLEDLQAIIDLELAAAADLDNAMPVEAGEKVEEARSRIETQGPEVEPPTDPPTFEPSLKAKVESGVAEADLKAEIQKRLDKAAKRDAKAKELIDKGQLDKAKKQLDKANAEKLRAKLVIETSVRAEAKAKF